MGVEIEISPSFFTWRAEKWQATRKGQRVLSVLEQAGNRSALGVVLWITLLGVFLSASAHAAVFTVNSSDDAVDANPGNGVCQTGNGLCTLRAAIQEANALAGADEIILPSLPPPNSYVLTIATELGITGNLTITGGGASTTIIDGNKSVRPNGRVLVIGSGITVNINGVTIRNGGTGVNGGGIFNAGTLTLTNSTVSGNDAGDDGGGIRNYGTTNVFNSTIANNRAGLNSSPNNTGGGGVFNGGTLTLTNSTVSGNVASKDGGGIFNLDFTEGAVTLTHVTFENNTPNDCTGCPSLSGRNGEISNAKELSLTAQ